MVNFASKKSLLHFFMAYIISEYLPKSSVQIGTKSVLSTSPSTLVKWHYKKIQRRISFEHTRSVFATIRRQRAFTKKIEKLLCVDFPFIIFRKKCTQKCVYILFFILYALLGKIKIFVHKCNLFFVFL